MTVVPRPHLLLATVAGRLLELVVASIEGIRDRLPRGARRLSDAP